jgi:hypothetical protein
MRFCAWVMAALVGVALVASLAVPLIVRGPVVRYLVGYETEQLCGSVSVRGGHFSLDLAPALIFGRSFTVTAVGVHVREPDGSDLFRAETLRARLRVRWRTWQLLVEGIDVADGAFRLFGRDNGQPPTVALKGVPSGGRSQCLAPGQGPQPQHPVRNAQLLDVPRLTLRNVSIALSFPMWAVMLDATEAHGTLRIVATSAGTEILFDARDVITNRGGTLAVGPRGGRLTPVVPFDHVEIRRVAVTDQAPQDLRLEVQNARTGRAALSGRAIFTNVFERSPGEVAAGMKLDARWAEVGHAMASSPGWSSVGRALAQLDATVNVSLHGSFGALAGSTRLVGKGLSVSARSLPRRRYELDLGFVDFDTRPLLFTRAQRALLRGRLNGQVFASARLGRTARDASVSIGALDLVLARDAVEGPRRVLVSHRGGAMSPGDLRLELGVAVLKSGVLRVEPLTVRWAGTTVSTDITAEGEPGSRALLLRARATPDSRIKVRGEVFLPPPLVKVRFEPARRFIFDPFTLKHVGGGALEASGTLGLSPSNPTDLSVAIVDYPLARVPGLDRARSIGREGAIGRLLAGRMNASFFITGPTVRPGLSGLLTLTKVRWAGQSLGDGRIDFRALRGGTRFEGALIDGLTIRGHLHQAAELGDTIEVRSSDVRLAPWLPRIVTATDPRVSGNLVWRPRSGSRPSATADLVVKGKGILLGVSARAKADEQGAKPVRTIEGSLSLRADGRELARSLGWAGIGSGTFRFSGTLRGTMAAPYVAGHARFDALTMRPPGFVGSVRVDGPLAVDDRSVSIGPLIARFESGGWLEILGPEGPGHLTLAPRLVPLRIKGADLIVRGSGVTTRRPVAGLKLQDAAVNLRLADAGKGDTLLLTGDAWLGHDTFRLSFNKKTKGPQAAAPSGTGPRIMRRVWADVRVNGPEDALKVRVQHLPDVTLGVHCHLVGLLSSPRVAGTIDGHDAYSRLALAASARLSGRDLRKCDLGGH